MKSGVITGLRGTSGKSVQVFQMQFVGLLLVLLVILGSKLNQPAQKEVKIVPREFLVTTQEAFSEIALGEIIQGTVVIQPQKLEALSYLLTHHDLKATIHLGAQATLPETFSLSDKILKALSQGGIKMQALSVQVKPEEERTDISVSFTTLESQEHLL